MGPRASRSCRAPRAGWSSCSPTSVRRRPARGVTIGVVGGVGRCGRDDVRLRARPGRRPHRPAAASSTPTRSVPASTGCSASTLVDGVRWDAPGPHHRSAQRAVAARVAAAPRRARGADLVRRTAPRRLAGVRRARGALGRPARVTTRWWSTCRAASDALAEEVVRAATASWSWSSPTVPGLAAAGAGCAAGSPTPAALGPGGARPRCRRPDGRATDRRAGRSSRWATSAGSPRRSTSVLGPVRLAREVRLGRAAVTVLSRPCGTGRHASGLMRACRPTSSTGSASSWPATPAPLTPHRVADALREPRVVRWATRPCSPSTRPCAVTSSVPVRSSRCCGCPASPTCWSTEPTQVYVDRGAGLERTGVRFPDDEAVRRLAQRLAAAGGPPARRRGRPTSTSGCADGTRFHAVLSPLARPGTVALAAGPASARASRSTSSSRPAPSDGREPRCSEPWSRRRLAFLVSGGTGSGKTTLLNALLSLVAARRAARAGRGRQRAAARPSPRRRRSRRGRPTSRAPARSPCAPWCARRCGCDPTGSSSARCAAPRSSTCWPRSTPATRAAAARSTPTRRATCRRGSRRSRLRPGSDATPPTASCLAGLDVVLHLARDRDGRRVLREVAVPSRRADGLAELRTAVSFADGGVQTGPGEADLVARLCR